MSFLSTIFKNKELERLKRIIQHVNEIEEKTKALSDEEILASSKKLKERAESESLDEMLAEAFALVREASRRTLGQRHFDVQLIGGAALHEGKIAEMMTGEGKTLAATLPAYLNALSGKGVHVVTVNDYLARRDTAWMGQVYHALGLTVSCIVHDSAYIYDPTYEATDLDKERDALGAFKVIEKFLRPITRKEAYAADITYGTNHDFGFDFLRDNLALRLQDKVQRGHEYAIIDEVDSILIDEARTPLIIAAPDVEASEFYKTFARVVDRLQPEEDYAVDEKLKSVNITESGIEKVEKMIGVPNIFAPEHSRLVHFLQESLKAKALFRKDKEYMVKQGQVFIVDEFTGRMLMGRRYSGGLHQAIEAKENVRINEENRTYAQITIQNYFRLYKKISGMTGTAQTSAEEFHKVYSLEVVSIPPNRGLARIDSPDVIYKTREGKYDAIVKEIKGRHEKGQPILLGTTSIANNEIISQYLTRAGIPHEVLNAKNNEREGAIIAQAGKWKAVTVATNMAGRGVDIILGGNPPDPDEAKRVKEAGGLHVLGTERHESRRIDNQLRGRAGRQGDSGSSQFFLSMEDDLLRIFGGDRMKNMMQTLKFPEDVPIESKLISRAVNQAQARVEGINFDIRKHLLDFDDVLNKQRTAIYRRREDYLKTGETNDILPLIKDAVTHYITANEAAISGIEDEKQKKENEEKLDALKKKFDALPEMLEKEIAILGSQHMVRILDTLWISHLESLEGLRETVNIRAYAQHEPLIEYRREAHILFQEMQVNFESLLATSIFPILEQDLQGLINQANESIAKPPEVKEIGRNDPCWCGSGKKFKKCHGK